MKSHSTATTTTDITWGKKYAIRKKRPHLMPWVNRNPKNSAIPRMTGGRITSAMPLCESAFQNFSSWYSLIKLLTPLKRIFADRPLQRVKANIIAEQDGSSRKIVYSAI